MQCKHWRGGLLVLVAVVVTGCGGSTDSSDSTATDKTNPTPKLNEPQIAVSKFLEAVRRGDDAAAAGMFTPVARQKAGELGIEVAPQGSDTARYEVGSVTFINDRNAHVDSSWTDLEEGGITRTDKMVWVVHHVEEGWRVAGMTASIFEGEPPLLLDFEKPQETLIKLNQLREEILLRDSNLAKQPQETGETTYR